MVILVTCSCCDYHPDGSAGMNLHLVTVQPEFEVRQLGPEGRRPRCYPQVSVRLGNLGTIIHHSSSRMGSEALESKEWLHDRVLGQEGSGAGEFRR